MNPNMLEKSLGLLGGVLHLMQEVVFVATRIYNICFTWESIFVRSTPYNKDVIYTNWRLHNKNKGFTNVCP